MCACDVAPGSSGVSSDADDSAAVPTHDATDRKSVFL